MPLKDYYQLLEIPATATPDEVKRAFRVQIARYHPDKVQHLGQEFQAMAADRAAELTEAYRILSDEGRRAEYDRARAAGPDIAPPPAAAPSPPPPSAAPVDSTPREPERAAPPPRPPEASAGPQFKTERASRDEFVRKATVGRVQSAVEAVGGSSYDALKTPGFDLAWAPKKGFLGRTKGPRLLCKFVSRVDKDSVAETWVQAMKAAKRDEDVCVFLMGTEVAPAGELATAIAEQRKKQRTSKLALIPVDARNWDAHIPLDAPAFAKTLIARLKTGQ